MEKGDQQPRGIQLPRDAVVALGTVTGMQSTYRVYGNCRNDPDVQIHKHMPVCARADICVTKQGTSMRKYNDTNRETYWTLIIDRGYYVPYLKCTCDVQSIRVILTLECSS